MENLYLKEADFDDLEIVKEWEQDYLKYNPDKRPYINVDSYNGWLDLHKRSQKDENSVHLFDYWLMLDNKVVGLFLLRTNIEAHEGFSKYGGNVGYDIMPSYQKRGYGTIGLHLALEKFKQMGLKEIMVCCDITNIASKKIIENNCGVFKDVVVQNLGRENDGKEYRYIIDIKEALKNIKKKKKK